MSPMPGKPPIPPMSPTPPAGAAPGIPKPPPMPMPPRPSGVWAWFMALVVVVAAGAGAGAGVAPGAGPFTRWIVWSVASPAGARGTSETDELSVEHQEHKARRSEHMFGGAEATGLRRRGKPVLRAAGGDRGALSPPPVHPKCLLASSDFSSSFLVESIYQRSDGHAHQLRGGTAKAYRHGNELRACIPTTRNTEEELERVQAMPRVCHDVR